jgi:hypothetical protein
MLNLDYDKNGWETEMEMRERGKKFSSFSVHVTVQFAALIVDADRIAPVTKEARFNSRRALLIGETGNKKKTMSIASVI